MKFIKRAMYVPLLMTIASSSWASLGGMTTVPNMSVKQLTHKQVSVANQSATGNQQQTNTQYVPNTVYTVKNVTVNAYMPFR